MDAIINFVTPGLWIFGTVAMISFAMILAGLAVIVVGEAVLRVRWWLEGRPERHKK